MMQQPGPGGAMLSQQQQQQPPQQYQQPPYMMMMPPPPMAHTQPPPQHMDMGQPPASADEVRTLWIGDLQYWMDENYIASCFAHTGEVASVKVIRNKQTSQIEGYGFIEFTSNGAAERDIADL
ncbi:hypothetical protein OIU84_014056 [Salix udensis]|uniref:RRM domain-containing protein n=1 Tax=Salix udensis TaxID=889485 RepID=A0AAD6JCX5_9ROSI|nr:hypothetical protein OIU84_014056 [Salix udensis]